jgi:hypothetical protein
MQKCDCCGQDYLLGGVLIASRGRIGCGQFWLCNDCCSRVEQAVVSGALAELPKLANAVARASGAFGKGAFVPLKDAEAG